MNSEHKHILLDGLWLNNPALVQVLGLCPLLAVSTGFVNSLSLGVATMFVLVLSNLTVSLCAPRIPATARLPVYVLLISSLVTCVELLIHSLSVELHNKLGIFLPLIVTNCIILGRAEAFASRNSPTKALLDGFYNGLGFAMVLVLLGSLRELMGAGKLFADMHFLTGGEPFRGFSLPNYDGFLLLILPPGGFIVLGFLIAGYNILREQQKRAVERKQTVAGSKRVRVTG